MAKLLFTPLLLVSLAAIVISYRPMTTYAQPLMTVQDAVGRTVQVPVNPSRIVCLSSGCLRLIVYLGAADKVVGIEKFERDMALGRPYRLAHPEFLSLPIISPGGPQSINQFPDLESVLSVTPQVIFITFMEHEKADELQQKIGIPVVVLSYGKFAAYDAKVFESLQIAGKILNKSEQASKIEDFLQAAKKDVRERSSKVMVKAPEVYVGATGYKGQHGLTSTDNPYIPLQWLGADNLTSRETSDGHVFLEKEKLLSLNPKTIFIDAAGLYLVAEDFAKSPGYYKALQAFQDNNVYVLYPYTMYVTNMETMIVDAYAAGKILYPTAFSDVDLRLKASEVFTFFVGKDVSDQLLADFGPVGAHPQFLHTAGGTQ